MWSPRTVAVGLLTCLIVAPAGAQEIPAKGKITAVDLFKNGLAVVTYEVALGKPGVYVLDEVPQPVHGTYSIESAGRVESLVKMRDVNVPVADVQPGNLQDDLAGKKVTVHFKGDKRAPVVGTVMKLKPAKGDEAAPQPGRYVVLQTGKGWAYIEASEVATVEVEEAGDTVKRSRPRLLLTLGAVDRPETKVTIRYLTRGLAWAPSYKIDITDPRTLSLEQNAVVRNELADLDGAEVRLISGYPSVQFSHVLSPLAPRVNWAAFFEQLGSGGERDDDLMSNRVVSQQRVIDNSRAGSFDLALGAIPSGEGADLHYQSIGKRTLAEGEALALSVARGKADYTRVVEWLVPDNRNAYGQYDGQLHAGGRRAVGRAEVHEPACVPDDDRPGDGRVRRPIQRPADELLGERRGGNRAPRRQGPERPHAVRRERATEQERGRARLRLGRWPAVPEEHGRRGVVRQQPPQGERAVADPPPLLRGTRGGRGCAEAVPPGGGRVLDQQAERIALDRAAGGG